MKINLVARLPALTAILLSLTLATRDVLGESSSSSHSSSIRDLKLEGDALLAKGEYLGASRAYSNAIGESWSMASIRTDTSSRPLCPHLHFVANNLITSSSQTSTRHLSTYTTSERPLTSLRAAINSP